MKKFLSVFLTAAMLLTLVVALAAPASAVDGAWWVYCSKGYYREDFEGDEPSIVGYEYTAEGLRVIPADWRDHKPAAGLQTKDKVDLKDGVYMLIRIDEFTFANDKWFNMNIWDSVMVSPGSTDVARNGAGVQNLIRPNDAGDVSGVQWYIDGFTGGGSSSMAADAEKKDANGKILLALTLTWDGSTYALNINGAAAPAAVITYMNEKWGGADSEAYVGFNLQNSNKGGTVGCTVLKFGTSKDSATIPMGDDSRAPSNSYLTIADIADESTVEAGKPAVFMNGSKTASDSKGNYGRSATGIESLNEDNTIHYVADKAAIQVSFTVKNEVSYDGADFPVAVALTRNFCTCGDDECYALESTNMYICNGNITGAADGYRITELSMSYDPIVKDGDTYLYFYTDLSEDAGFDYSGRINGCRFDLSGIDYQTAGNNAFDICWVAYFRTIEEAETFIYEWIGVEEETDAPTTDAPVADATDAPAVDGTEAPAVDATTEAPAADATDAPAVDGTEAPAVDGTDAPATGDKEPASSCKSVVGFGAIAMVAVAAVAGMVAFKKED